MTASRPARGGIAMVAFPAGIVRPREKLTQLGGRGSAAALLLRGPNPPCAQASPRSD